MRRMWADGILKLVGLERRDARLSEWSPELAAIFGAQPSASGIAVGPERALQSPTFLACVRVISETLGAMPVHVFKKGQDGARERVTDHPAAELLGGDWTPWESGADAKTVLQTDVMLHGVAFAQVIRVGQRPKEIHRLEPRNVTIDRTGSEPIFKTKVNGQDRRLDWRDVIFISTPGSAPGRPMSLVRLLSEAIGLDLVLMEHEAKLFANGARPGGILKMVGKLSPERQVALAESWSRFRSGSTAVLEDGMSFEPQTMKSTDAQFLELRRLASQDIARGCKVPGTLIGDLERGTWRNIEELSRQFVTMTLLPWIERWTPALTRTLLTPSERRTMYLEFVPEDLLRGDLVGRFSAYRQAVGGAFLTPNEIRALENRPPIDGGDKLILQAGQGGADDVPTPAPTPSRPKAVA